VLLLALVPAATEVAAVAILALVDVLIWTMIAYETRGYGEGRARVRHGDEAPAAR
jgi:hypothetical protein